ncbi:response regulator transcription factor [Lichenicola cladoniae]|uniref:Response regulator transcription factor n=1 Tax=Lichenicola cladoniae TaxID=1484109 RepID=A0A6M8HL24_9PROT|nr:response regulator transcription factor [Lichenicola cladoniae]NPD65185.1 response regulator transcription factor [Acetobacteraceae bacterium]QKE88785.1 response regulator transcription factor [Lichenicola cladoniae]
MRLLLIEDDSETAAYIVEGLRELTHDLHVAVDGRGGLARASAETWDVIILDRMLPGLDGLSVLRRLRATGVETPVLFLTTLDGINDRVAGLDAGADDYMVKPFALAELAARLAAIIRRRQPPAPTVSMQVSDLEMNLLTRSVFRAGRAVILQPREFRLLEFLMQREGEVVTRTMLLEHVWEFYFDPNTNIVESHISRLRDKLGRDQLELIHTVRGAGYVLQKPSIG